ncbi:hypothetical protein PSECIP111951_02394 [Pseudoalteromonas holothuriae]|uniref:OmpR/PhoB-type domain-containing protein n=1 Tax=Pseudoalteromonas holothuriae TaxID=2963714 RepID=A0A9W4QUI4_9GAMM|nr:MULTISPECIES: winged helix-turn-helix domain-containing protein [unclassified Pseudoalteromonas]CAH9053843.1 hypothetical protein PSECIP111854_01250 [Pseudoalteromonas sp. CIP111854]CAH9060990.1 hypothetical protein PSECIP111951_02394 [Pseudoalteromonas sp. CIP111951]
MKFSFSHFEFDCDALVLTNKGKVFSLNEKPAKLLALLIMGADRIHSKDEILEVVWPGRTVTNQVVFQSIGHLRALFGDDAIKTFSRKGYQWQLPLVPVKDDDHANNKAPEQEELPKNNSNERHDNSSDEPAEPSTPSARINRSTAIWPVAAVTILGVLAGVYFLV